MAKEKTVMTPHDMTALMDEINEMKSKNRSPWLHQFQIGSKMYRVVQMKDNLYFLNRDGEYLLFDPENKKAVHVCDVNSSKILHDKNIPWDLISRPSGESSPKRPSKRPRNSA